MIQVSPSSTLSVSKKKKKKKVIFMPNNGDSDDFSDISILNKKMASTVPLPKPEENSSIRVGNAIFEMRTINAKGQRNMQKPKQLSPLNIKNKT